MQADLLVGLKTELGKAVRKIDGYDHRTLQWTHDAIAAAFRYVEANNLDPLLPGIFGEGTDKDRILDLWKRFCHDEVESILHEEPSFARLVLEAAVYANPDKRGMAAEDALYEILNNRYPWRIRYTVDQNAGTPDWGENFAELKKEQTNKQSFSERVNNQLKHPTSLVDGLMARTAKRTMLKEEAEVVEQDNSAPKPPEQDHAVDPEMLAIGIEMTAIYIEAGVRTFSDYARSMVSQLGDWIKPHMRMFWSMTRVSVFVDESIQDELEDPSRAYAQTILDKLEGEFEDRNDDQMPDEGNAGNQSGMEYEMDEIYYLNDRDKIVVSSAILLVEKIINAPCISPAEQVSVAKVLHVLKHMPASSESITVSIGLSGPTRCFGEHEINHYWSIEIEDDQIRISSGGYFYRPSTGGDSFTCMSWNAAPGCEPDYGDFLDRLYIVDDAQPFDDEVAELNLTDDGYDLTIMDDENPLLDEDCDFDEDEELDEEIGEEIGDAIALSEAEQALSKIADEKEGRRRDQCFAGPVEACDFCRRDLNDCRYFVDGRVPGGMMFAYFCPDCVVAKGGQIGWGSGQLYKHEPNGDWLMVAGFPPDEE
ncbi:MAG: hypothetical protein K9N10_22810 [Deltaproteobacteria bacterium]|nr:hypothetical protein [Deltaproteobacteria bacterium]